jgi:hypothetical protein
MPSRRMAGCFDLELEVPRDCLDEFLNARDGQALELSGSKFAEERGVNYAGAIGRNSARVVSCNTTALSRTSHALHLAAG